MNVSLREQLVRGDEFARDHVRHQNEPGRGRQERNPPVLPSDPEVGDDGNRVLIETPLVGWHYLPVPEQGPTSGVQSDEARGVEVGGGGRLAIEPTRIELVVGDRLPRTEHDDAVLCIVGAHVPCRPPADPERTPGRKRRPCPPHGIVVGNGHEIERPCYRAVGDGQRDEPPWHGTEVGAGRTDDQQVACQGRVRTEGLGEVRARYVAAPTQGAGASVHRDDDRRVGQRSDEESLSSAIGHHQWAAARRLDGQTADGALLVRFAVCPSGFTRCSIEGGDAGLRADEQQVVPGRGRALDAPCEAKVRHPGDLQTGDVARVDLVEGAEAFGPAVEAGLKPTEVLARRRPDSQRQRQNQQRCPRAGPR